MAQPRQTEGRSVSGVAGARLSDLLVLVRRCTGEVRWSFSVFVGPQSTDQIVLCAGGGARDDQNRCDETAQLNDDGKTFHVNNVGTKIRLLEHDELRFGHRLGRHCEERQRRSNPYCPRGVVDCFASLAMTIQSHPIPL